MTATTTLDAARVAAPPAARVAAAGGAAFVALLATVHVLKRDVDPAWRFISEYAVGEHGWLMTVAFLAFALGYAALAAALRPSLSSIGGRIGLVLLWVSAGALAIAGIFTTDPITSSPQDATTAGFLHNFGATLGLAMPLAALVVGVVLGRHPSWRSSRRPIVIATLVALTGFVVALGWMAALLEGSGGRFGPDVPVGWANRLEILLYASWLIVVASTAARAQARASGRLS